MGARARCIRSRLAPLLLPVAFVGCGAAQLAIKQPVPDQCAARGLKGCPELTDAVMTYLGGDAAAAEPKLRAAAAANSPEQIRAFAEALRPIADGVGGETAAAMRVVIGILTEGAAPAERAAAGAPGASPAAGERSAIATAADGVDSLRSGVTLAGADAKAVPCEPGLVASGAAVCKRVRVAVGPLVVTNVYASGQCPDEVFVLAGRMARPQWLLLAPSRAPLNVTGRFVVDDGEELVAGTRASSSEMARDVTCAVTWAGYRP